VPVHDTGEVPMPYYLTLAECSGPIPDEAVRP
jgi:hypothetical protein